MDLLPRFRNHYYHYLISIIIPTIITAVSIPLFRVILGAEAYGNFAISFNAVLLCTATLSGWIAQSVFRFYPGSTDKKLFVKKSVNISFKTQLLFCFPVFVVVWFLQHDWLLALFFVAALFITSLQFTVVAVSQSIFLSKKNIYSELFRSVSYILVALLLLRYSPLYYIYSLFIAIIFSYAISFFYLQKQVNKTLVTQSGSIDKDAVPGNQTKQFLWYGAPLSLWFIFAYLITLTDKVFMRHGISGEVQGNYQAIFDLISKSITLIIYPVTVSLLPVLTGAFEKGERKQIKELLLKILAFEFAGFLLVSALYWWFGANILFGLTHTPNTDTYKALGQVVIAGTFTWQLAIIVQKKLELQFKSRQMLLLVALAYLIQLLFYFIFRNSVNELVFAFGYLVSATAYLFLISFPELVNLVKYRNKKKAG